MVAMTASESADQTASSTGIDSQAIDPEIMLLDEQTEKDLEIFSAAAELPSLFEFCNLSRTKGGAKVLHQRMQRPWATAARIHDTQAAIGFILDHRQAFSQLSSAFIIGRVALYTHDILPVITQQNSLEFGFSALGLWANHDRFYTDIVRGVEVTCTLVRSLRRFIGQVELNSAKGELAPLVEEMRALLARPGLVRVADKKPRARMGEAWRVLRLDQVFRSQEKMTLARLLQLVHEIDALTAMADVTGKYQFVLPKIEAGPLRVEAEGLVHPFVVEPVPNSVALDQNHRVLFLTGPNMAGKTTYLRAFATALYLAHLGMGVPAQRFNFVPAQRLFSSFSLQDDLRGGISYFRAEALRVKAIAQAVADGYRVIALMDEPFKGTNVKDALDASEAIIERFAVRKDCLFMFSSHLIELGEQLGINGQVDCRYFEAMESEGRLRFDYLLHKGVSSQRLGMRVLREEGIFRLLDELAPEV
ncbi:MAG: hypothetical protein KUG79_02970 [Pseudomonadales bacterium]|nr:hypothetical protein [Pseudomonadales bacterium]